MTVLSILIPTIPQRGEQFNILFKEVNRQALTITDPKLGSVEIVVDNAPRFLDGGPSIGKKRENLVKKATGKYLCFLDDDESIAPNYLEVLLRLCAHGRDVCTFRNISKLENHFWMIVDMSLSHTENEQATPERMIKRKPWHICPVISYFAKLHPFPDTSYGEDWAWFEQVLSHCQTEAKSDAVIHGYNYSSKTSEADKITNA